MKQILCYFNNPKKWEGKRGEENNRENESYCKNIDFYNVGIQDGRMEKREGVGD